MDASGGGDPLAGYFLGSYGSHGDELLYLQRGLWQGREAIIAHKVTGACLPACVLTPCCL